MSGTKSSQGGLTRRSFLKTTAAVAGATALAGGASLTALADDVASADSEERVFSSVCRGNCGGACSLKVTVREGKAVRVDPQELPDGFTRICQRGRTHVQYIYNENRIKYPMRRVGERGSGEWERVTWEEAIEEIGSKWKADREQYGPASLAMHSGLGNYGMAFGAWYGVGYPNKFLNVVSAVSLNHLYDYANGVYSSMTNVGVGIMPDMLLKSDCIVLWGYNATDAYPHIWRFIAQARQQGAKLVVVDPNYTTSASKADLWVRIRPGTDGALALALVNMAIDRGFESADEIRHRTTLPFLLKGEGGLLRASDVGLAVGEADEEVVVDESGEVVRASAATSPRYTGVSQAKGIAVTTVYDALRENIKEWTPERAAKVCGVGEDVIEELFAAYTERKPVAAGLSLGIDHYTNGTMAYVCIALLSSITGNMSLPGGGADSFAAPGVAFMPNVMGNVLSRGFSQSPDVPMNMLPEIMESGKFGDVELPIKNLFILQGNALSNQVSRNEMIAALDKIEMVVVSDVIMNDSAQYADIVLPCCHWFEQKDAVLLYHPNVTLQERAIEPLYEAKTNYEIIQLLAGRLGFGDAFNESEEDVLKMCFDSEALAAQGVTYERLLEEKVLPVQYGEGSCVNAADGRANYYFGPGGRWVNSGGAGGYYDYGQEIDWSRVSLPTWYPPYEAWTETIDEFEQSEASKKYPLIFTTFRSKMRTHTQFAYNSWLLELYPEPTVMVRQSELDKRGISEGSLVRLFNDRGEVVVRVAANQGIHEGMAVMLKGWQNDQFVAGHYSNLTSRYMNPAASNCYFFDAVCEMELYGGEE